jgi:hypothetical protein
MLYQRIQEDKKLKEEIERLPPTKVIIDGGSYEPDPSQDE